MSKKIEIIGLMACTKQGVIGFNGKLPWYYKSETEHFDNMVRNNIMIMGRKTYDDMHKFDIMQHSTSFILTKSDIKFDNKNCFKVSSINELLNLNFPKNKKIFMIGGGQIASLFLENNLINRFILTKIHKDYTGDTFFPLSLIKNWQENILKICDDYTIYNLKP